MERLELYKGFRLRAYDDWWAQWFAEARRFFDAEWIATPTGHSTKEAAIDFIKRMIDSPSTTIKAPKMIQ